jgi:hypothetical protein
MRIAEKSLDNIDDGSADGVLFCVSHSRSSPSCPL